MALCRTQRAPDIDETPETGELPRAYCARMAREKVAAVDAEPEDIVLCADTTVALGRRILGKPADFDEAEAVSARPVRTQAPGDHRRGGAQGGSALGARCRQYRADEALVRTRDRDLFGDR